MGKILLEGMEFFAFHGCFREEQIIGTKFRVDLHIEADLDEAEHSDHLKDTVDYVALYQAVKIEMDQKSHLLEHVARRILDRLKHQFPGITSIWLKIAKNNPPMGGKMHQVCYVAEWKAG
jgi:dihydroneopterin aldolase